MNTNVINISDWKKNYHSTKVSTTFEYEDCAKAFMVYFIKANNAAKSDIVVTRQGNKVTFSVPSDHNEMSSLWVVASTKFFEAGYKTACLEKDKEV